jgi:hypothetical protein
MAFSIPTIDTETMVYILLVLCLILALLVIRLENRLKKMLGGKSAKNLEESVNNLHKSTEELKAFRTDSIEYLKNIEARLKRSIQGVETVRFNPFKGTGEGGNQSFSTALVNEKGDGAVISSLYSRDRVSVFSKPLKKFSSEFEMTAEEHEATKKAKESLAYQNQYEKR